MHVASSWRSRGVEAENGWVDVMGCIGLFYPKIVVLVVLGPRCVSVFYLLLGPTNRTLEGWVFLPLLLPSFSFLRIQRVGQDPNLFQ
jgi:hypothetical protein